MKNQHWFKEWLGAARQQVITWANVDQELCHHMSSLDHNAIRWDKFHSGTYARCRDNFLYAPSQPQTMLQCNDFSPWLGAYMMTSSNGNIFRVTGPLCGEFTGPGEFPAQRAVMRSFDVFFDLCLNKRLSKQPWGWWFETPSWSLWCHCNVQKLIPQDVMFIVLLNGSINGLWILD